MENPITKIDEELADLRQQIAAIQAAAQKEVAARNERVHTLVNTREVLVGFGYAAEKSVTAPEGRQPKSAKQLLIKALAIGDLWHTAAELQEIVSGWAGREIPMGTISPYLTELRKTDELIVRKGLRVALKSRVETEQPSFFVEEDRAASG